MARKTKDPNKKKTHIIQIRTTLKEKNRIKGLARLYGYASMSEYMLHTLDLLRPDRKISK